MKLNELIDTVLSYRENFEFLEWIPEFKMLIIYDSDMGAYSQDDFHPGTSIVSALKRIALRLEKENVNTYLTFSKSPMRTYQ